MIINYLLPGKWRRVWLLTISYGLYTLIDIRFPIVMLIGSVLSFLVARKIEASDDQKVKHRWLIFGLVSVLAPLFVFKYANFFFESLQSIISTVGWQWNFRGIELFFPLGISFYSLQIISYIMDVYHGRIAAEVHPDQFALYVAFFPKLLNGPIERYQKLRAQIADLPPFDYQTLIKSLVRIGWGLFKKLVIADRLAVVANTVFAAPQNFFSPQLVYAILAFSFQIYIDFSAYCDIAIGLAKILGIDLSENFDSPYLARSVGDFWRRWHISLSNWLRDYIFIPLTIKHRREKPLDAWKSMDVIVTFLISGLWHGASWTFVAWGALHGVYQAFEILTAKLRNKVAFFLHIDRESFAHKTLQTVITFMLISFTWLFFKARSISEVWPILKSIITLEGITTTKAWLFSDGTLGLDKQDMGMMVFSLIIFLITEYVGRRCNLLEGLIKQPIWFRWAIYLLLIFSVLLFGFYGDTIVKEFVYFQF